MLFYGQGTRRLRKVFANFWCVANTLNSNKYFSDKKLRNRWRGVCHMPTHNRGCHSGSPLSALVTDRVVSTEVPIIIYYRGPIRAAKAEANTIAARGYKLPRIQRDSRRD
jgi:hypothetical protein